MVFGLSLLHFANFAARGSHNGKNFITSVSFCLDKLFRALIDVLRLNIDIDADLTRLSGGF